MIMVTAIKKGTLVRAPFLVQKYYFPKTTSRNSSMRVT